MSCVALALKSQEIEQQPRSVDTNAANGANSKEGFLLHDSVNCMYYNADIIPIYPRDNGGEKSVFT